MRRQLVRVAELHREELVFFTEQSMLPLSERVCLSCLAKGKGCRGCDRTGTLLGALKRYTGSDFPDPEIADSDHFKDWLTRGHFTSYW